MVEGAEGWVVAEDPQGVGMWGCQGGGEWVKGWEVEGLRGEMGT